MNKEMILADFAHLAEFMNEIELPAFVEGAETEIPTLAVILSEKEDEYQEAVVCNYLPIPEQDVEFSKMLQLYLRIPVDLSVIEDAYLLVLANQLNLLTAVGHFVTRGIGETGGAYLAMRHVIPFPADELPDEGVFGETILLMSQYMQVAEEILVRLIEGEPIEELLKLLPAGDTEGWGV